jgi:hypothetical protein
MKVSSSADDASASAPSEDKKQVGDSSQSPETQGGKPTQETPPKPRRVFGPRTCRICLEVVSPSYETRADGFDGMINPSPKVQYISEDAASGRLIRPCKCKSSQRYVHEGCLEQWRHADASYSRPNFWECPTCRFRYRLERMRWSRWIGSTITQISLTVLVILAIIFVLGFVADPIITFCGGIADMMSVEFASVRPITAQLEDEGSYWVKHFAKGAMSLAAACMARVLLASSIWNLLELRFMANGGRHGRAAARRISWTLALIGFGTFLWVRTLSSRFHFAAFSDPTFRVFGKAYKRGAAGLWRERVNMLQMCRVRTTATKNNILHHCPADLPNLKCYAKFMS